MIKVEEVKTRRQLKKFVKFQNKIYKGNPYYVPYMIADEMTMLNPKKNPALATCEAKWFIAKEGNKMVGRIGVIVNKADNEINNRKYVRFTRFECVEDFEVAKALIDTAEQFALDNGFDTVHGPMGFNDMDKEGMLVEGFDRLATFCTQYNHKYYVDFIEKLGYVKDVDWVEYRLTAEAPDPRIEKISASILKRCKLHEACDDGPFKKVAAKYGQDAFKCVNEAYSELYSYVPLSEKTVDSLIKQFTVIGNSRYISVLVDENDNVVGFAISFPHVAEALNKCKGKMLTPYIFKLLHDLKHPKGLEFGLIAVRPEFKGKGINAVMMSRIMRNAIEDGIRYAETNPELETNHLVQGQWDSFEKEQHKRRRCYIKHLTEK